MPDQNSLSLNGARVEAVAAQTRMAACVMSLFQSGFAPSITSTKADFEAEECDFDGYAPKTIATFAAPLLSGDGYSTFGPTQVFAWTLVTDAVGNSVGGYWLETAGGELIGYGTFDPSRPAQGPDQAVVVTPILQFNAG